MNLLWENIFRKNANELTVSRILKSNVLFRNLSQREIKFIESIIHERKYRAGEVVFRQGEAGVGMYIIAKGCIDIIVSEEPVISGISSKDEVLITRLSEEDFFGELSLVQENGQRTASAVAATDAVLLGFFKPDLMEVLERNPATGVKVVFKLAEVLGRRLGETTDKISAIKKELKNIKRQQVDA